MYLYLYLYLNINQACSLEGNTTMNQWLLT